MKQVVIYPRGFAGFDIGLPVRVIKQSQAQVFKSIIHNNTSARDNKVVISNTDVEDMWKQLTNGNRFISNEKFRESILQSALAAFGTKDFLEWIILQENNNYMSATHIRFINDTLNFIKTGNRSLNIQFWLQLLVPNNLEGNGAVKINKAGFFNIDKPLHMRDSTLMKNFIIKWVSQPNGFEDLLGTLHVLFGDSDIL